MAPLAWVAWVPFLLAASAEGFTRRPYLVSYLVAVVYWLGNLYWLLYVSTGVIPGYILIGLYLGLYWPVMVWLIRFCRRRLPWLPLFVVAGLVILGAEAWQGILIDGFNWRLLAHSQYRILSVIQIADVFGELGVSLVIALVNGLVAELILVAGRGGRAGGVLRPQHLAKAAVVAAAVIGTVVYGRWRIGQTPACVSKGPLLGSVQPNIPSHRKEMADEAEPILRELIGRSEQCFAAGAKLVAWPETIVMASLNPEYVRYCLRDSTPVRFDAMIREHARGKGYVLAGAHGADLVFRADEPIITDRYNSAYLYLPDGTQSPLRYDKIHLVPFGEYIPLRDKLPWFNEIIKRLSPYDYDYHLTKGTEHTVFTIRDGQQSYRFGVLICYEDTDAAVARKNVMGPDGKAHWLLNISNDGWYVGYKDGIVFPSEELPQRTAITVFRAVENHIAILRSVNTGISCLIDSTGRIRDDYAAGDLPEPALRRQGVEGWFVDAIPIDSRVTFFSRHGLLLKASAAIMFGVVLLAALYERLMRPRGKKRRPMKTMASLTCLALLLSMAGCEGLEGLRPPVGGTTGVDPCTLRAAALKIAVQGMTDRSSYARAAAVEVVAAAGPAEMMPQVTDLLRDPVAPVRFAAALAVGDARYEPGRLAAQNLLEDADESVRIAAAYALARLGDTQQADRIRAALSVKDQTVRANAALLLGKLGDRRDTAALYKALHDIESGSQVRIQAVESIARLGAAGIYREKLWPLLISAHADDRVMGIKGMGALATEDARNAIVTMLQDEVVEVRLCAAGELARLGDRRGQDEVVAYLKRMPPTSEQTFVANNLAALAVGYLGGESTQFLPELLRDRSGLIQLSATRSALALCPAGR